MFEKMGRGLSRWSLRWIPDPYIFTILLTLLTFVLGIFLARQAPLAMVRFWGNSFFELLAFSMQMALILVTGHVVASSPVILKGIRIISNIPKNSRQAVFMVGLLAAVAGLINWGLGLIVGALLARDVAKQGHLRGIRMHYPLLAAAGYLGLMVWHGGFSGSAPLLVATSGHFLEAQIGVIAASQTLFSPVNLVVSIGLLFIAPLIAVLLHPRDPEHYSGIDPAFVAELEAQGTAGKAEGGEKAPAARMENSFIFTILIGLGGLYYIVWHFCTRGFDLNLNIVIFIFLVAGIWFHWSPLRLVKAVGEAAKGVGGVILLFPFYAGIMGMMRDSGMVKIFADWFVSISNSVTYPLFTLISAAIVNLFVPSGGGQWAVQGPIMIEAAPYLGVSFEKVIMAVAYGDQLTNMLQPFWAIALLGIVRLKARDIIGYTLGVMFFALIYTALCVMFIPG
jgi:short-chain fatty acids transporter